MNSYNQRQLKRATSKYDYIKVRVWIGSNYHVFSRFLLFRMLRVVGVTENDAAKISKKLKKRFIDVDKMDVLQKDLESELFQLLLEYNYREAQLLRYKKLVNLYQIKTPILIILSTILPSHMSDLLAQEVSQRLNVSNVVHTSFAWKTMSLCFHPTCCNINCSDFLFKEYSSPEFLGNEYDAKCEVVSKAVTEDIRKALRDGRPAIVEGMCLDETKVMQYFEFEKESPSSHSDSLTHWTKYAAVMSCSIVLGKECLDDGLLFDWATRDSTRCPHSDVTDYKIARANISTLFDQIQTRVEQSRGYLFKINDLNSFTSIVNQVHQLFLQMIGT